MNFATPSAELTPQAAAALVAPYLPSGGGSGPWLNAAAPGNGLPPVVNGQDATAALQAQINYLAPSGGIIQLPPGVFPISATLQMKGAVTLLGAGSRATTIGISTDTTAMHFDSTVAYGGFRDLFLTGMQNGAATQNCVVVDTGIPVIIRDSHIWGGNWALDTAGVDGLYENVYLNGYGTTGGGIKSTGANWYLRCKINCGPQAVNVGFYQGAYALGSGVAENHITQCDFSGNYQLSLYIEDGVTNTAVTTIIGSVFSSPISIPHHHTTILTANELGSTFLYAGPGDMVLTGNVAFQPTTVQGPGNRVLSGNLRIT